MPMAGGGEPSPSPPSPTSPAKHSRSPDDAQPDASPKRRKRHHNRHHHRRTHRHRSPAAVAANPMGEDEVEEGEILDDAAAAAAAMDVDADSAAPQASLAPEPFSNAADTDSNADASKLHASAVSTHSSSKDERKSPHSALESESGRIPSSDAEDTKGCEQSQSVSKSPQPTSEKGRRHRHGHHTSSSKDRHSKDHSRTSYSRHHSEAHVRDHSRSREKGAEAKGSRASLRDDSDHDINDRHGKAGRHATRSRENERERSSSCVVRDGHGDRHDGRERYRDDRSHSSIVVDRDKIDSHEATRRHRERSSSRSRSDRRESAHAYDESRERERRSGSSRHNDHERRRDTSKDRRSEAATMQAAAVASPLLLSLSSSPSPFLSSPSTSFLPPSSSAGGGRRKPALSVLRSLRAEAATLPVLSFTGEKVGETVLDLKSAPPSTARAVVHRAIITDRQNARRGTASTLTRGEVRGGGRKPYQQKKTGKARRGSQRTPLRPGGGVVFGPKPRDWSIKINRKEKRLAISTAIASAAVSEDAFVVEEFDEAFAAGPKTREFVAALQRWGLDPKQKAMFFATEFDDNVRLSGRNIGSLKMLTPRTLNLYDILDARKLFFTPAAVDYLNSRYGATVFDEYEDDTDGEEEVEEQEEEESITVEAAQEEAEESEADSSS